MRLQRSPFLTAYWNGDQLVARDVSTGSEIGVDGAILDVLNRAAQPVDRVSLEVSPEATQRVAQLVDAGMLVDAERESTTLDALQRWEKWAPEATFFHFGTKNQRFEPKPELRIIGPDHRSPPATKAAAPDAPRVALDPVPEDGEFVETLLARVRGGATARTG